MAKLTLFQRAELIGKYVEVVVDNMDTESLVEYVKWKLEEYYDNVSDSDLKDSIDEFNEELYDELVDNVTTQTTEVK
tara:strand:+ start:45 stop:275 length:231 start_codon:yes stop_codon:yes gene_type:complete